MLFTWPAIKRFVLKKNVIISNRRRLPQSGKKIIPNKKNYFCFRQEFVLHWFYWFYWFEDAQEQAPTRFKIKSR